MRRCCCCIPVLVGATILTTIGIIMAALELIPVVAYLVNVENDVGRELTDDIAANPPTISPSPYDESSNDGKFDPIGNNIPVFLNILKKLLQERNYTGEHIREIEQGIRGFLWPFMIGEAVAASFYLLLCLMVILGIHCDCRGLMIPYMVLQMIFAIIFIVAGISLSVIVFFYDLVMGIVCSFVFLNIAVFIIYFWAVVQKAYVEMGNRDYMYSPAPVKPIFNPPHHAANGSGGRGGGGLYPSSPQHFQMQDSPHKMA